MTITRTEVARRTPITSFINGSRSLKIIATTCVVEATKFEGNVMMDVGIMSSGKPTTVRKGGARGAIGFKISPRTFTAGLRGALTRSL